MKTETPAPQTPAQPLVKPLDIRFKNGKWPSVQAFVPGYYPWKAGAKGLEALCVTLEQALAVLDGTGELPFAREITSGWGGQLCGLLGILLDRSPCGALLDCRADMERFFARR